LKDHEPIDASSTPPRWSASTRKSSASFSIYSTFGGDSFTSQEALDSSTSSKDHLSSSSPPPPPQDEDDLAQIVANNMTRRNQARIILDATDDDDDSNSDQDDEVFVDADEYSDIDREKFDARLSKRLSGGHFGSAGGLLHSIEAASSQRRSKKGGLDKPLPQLLPSTHDNDDDEGHELEDARLHQQDTTPSTTLFGSPLTTSRVWHENPNLVLNGFGMGLLSPSVSTDDSSLGDSQEAKVAADRLWREDESFVTKAHMAEWLGTR
jgi:hypothetical protein